MCSTVTGCAPGTTAGTSVCTCAETARTPVTVTKIRTAEITAFARMVIALSLQSPSTVSSAEQGAGIFGRGIVRERNSPWKVDLPQRQWFRAVLFPSFRTKFSGTSCRPSSLRGGVSENGRHPARKKIVLLRALPVAGEVSDNRERPRDRKLAARIRLH